MLQFLNNVSKLTQTDNSSYHCSACIGNSKYECWM